LKFKYRVTNISHKYIQDYPEWLMISGNIRQITYSPKIIMEKLVLSHKYQRQGGEMAQTMYAHMNK
jgi:hypothetical protein